MNINLTTINRTAINRTGITKIARRSSVVLAAVIGLSAVSVGAADAGMDGSAVVTCNGAYNTIEVTPRVTSDYSNADQYTAVRVWIATWNQGASRWDWQANAWKVELAGRRNNPMATDISRLSTQSFASGDGYHYVYVESYMWNGQSWSNRQGQYTASYTIVTPSVSHEPSSQSQSNFCTL
jgi:hypothetical protein